jgi:hypothetical protein
VVVWPSSTGAPGHGKRGGEGGGSYPAGSPGSSGAVVTSPDIAAIVTLGLMRRGWGAGGIYPANSKSMVILGSTLAMIPE